MARNSRSHRSFSRLGVGLIAAVVGGLLVLVGSTGAAEAAPACTLSYLSNYSGCINDLSLTTLNANVTNGAVVETVTIHATDPTGATNAGVRYIDIRTDFTPSPIAYPNPASWDYPTSFPDIESAKLVSGTPVDGIWQATMTLYAGDVGTYALSASIATRGASQNLSASDLAAAGLPSAITTYTTAAPVAPTGISGGTSAVFNTIAGFPHFELDGVITWKTPANTAVASNVLVDSASTACGVNHYGAGTTLTFVDRTLGFCTVKFRLANGSGLSPQVSVTFF
ncbi:hypothetical protein SAMN05444157_2809 [Frankineae bacterium MT45]|nr:hypothetical protein SAMN05444157_2809 [Frankineae bacterium MT45]